MACGVSAGLTCAVDLGGWRVEKFVERPEHGEDACLDPRDQTQQL
jgi:hypothetical protein